MNTEELEVGEGLQQEGYKEKQRLRGLISNVGRANPEHQSCRCPGPGFMGTSESPRQPPRRSWEGSVFSCTSQA